MKHWKITTNDSEESSMVSPDGKDRGSDPGDISMSWSAAVAAYHEKTDEPEHLIGLTTTDERDEAREAPSADDNSVEEKKSELLTVDASPSKDGSIPDLDLSANKNSPFRQSLDEEAKAKDLQRSQEAERIANSKQMLRESMNSLSNAVDAHGESVLTRPERNFLEMLLEANGPGAAEACVAAHQRLMDGNLFWTICGGAAGEVNSMIPGHGWQTSSVNESMASLAHRDSDGSSAWVQDWVARGSQDSSKGSLESDDKKKPAQDAKDGSEQNRLEGAGDKTPAPAMKSHVSSNAESCTSISSSTKELLRPYELQHTQSSAARLSRLELRKRQSFTGKDNNRLFRAHEAGLVVTPGGSARRSLMRMGLPMEKGLYGPPQMPSLSKSTTELGEDGNDGQEDPNETVLTDNLTTSEKENITLEPSTFEKALAKMDERTIRRIEKEERAKQKREAADGNYSIASPSTAVFNTGDCISPFSMNILRRMFASKQFSFHRSSSSYSRFDSFLNTTSTTEHGILSGSTTASESDSDEKDEIFRPSSRPSTSEERLRNLLINAGFKDDADDDDEDHVIDATAEDDADIMSVTSKNTVAVLMQGGPSYRNVSMFRGESQEEKKDGSKNRLINTGFEDDGENHVTDATAEDDADIMSVTSKNTVAALMRGGPSYRDVSMFRGESPDEKKDGEEEDTPKTINIKKPNLEVNNTIGSLVSSLGSKSAPGSPAEKDVVKASPSDEADVSPANSDVIGELPTMDMLSKSERLRIPVPAPPAMDRLSKSERSPRIHKRSSTVGIMKSSSSTNNGSTPSRKYKRSVSWGQMVFAKEEGKVEEAIAMAQAEDSVSAGLSVISFPNLRRAVPVRSDSIGSNTSGIFSFPPSLKMGAPVRSESIGSMASILSPVPSLSRAQPVFSPRPSFSRMESQPMLMRANSVHSIANSMQGVPSLVPSLMRAHAVRSESQMTMDTAALNIDNDDDNSLNSENYVEAKKSLPKGAAWESPFASKKKPPLHDRSSSFISLGTSGDNTGQMEHPVFIRQASCNNYEGMGIEVEDVEVQESLDDARKFSSMISVSEYSVHSSIALDKSWRSVKSSRSLRNGPPIQALDDSFIIKNIDFERHSSEILRSLSNEDLYTSHNLETVNGASSKGSKSKRQSDHSSVARLIGNEFSESWELDSGVDGVDSFPANAANAWAVLEDEYAEGYGADNSLPFQILGTSAADTDCHPHVLSPPLMESLQNFLPPIISESNFWLKYSLVRDGASLPSLLRHIRGTRHTLIAIETVEGEVFGSFTSSPWRKNWNYYGNGEAFLWRMRRTRSEKDAQYSVLDQAKLESELDVFYWTGKNDLVQYCTHDMIAVGGGALQDDGRDDEIDATEERDLPPQNPAFTKADKGGFGLAIDSELLRGTSSPCATFQSPPLSKAHSNGSPFEILNIEVWTLTPCANVTDAETLEMKTLFLEGYSRQS